MRGSHHRGAMFALLIGAALALVAPGAARAEEPAQQLDSAVDQIVGDLLALPGWDIRRSYLDEVIAGADAELAARLESARQLLGLLEPQEPSPARLRALLQMAVDADPAVREGALAAAASGAESRQAESSQPASQAPASELAAEGAAVLWPLPEVAHGVGALAWGMTAVETRNLLGNVQIQGADDWSGPTYPNDQLVLSVPSVVHDCEGDLSLVFTENGLSRAWFVASESGCWSQLSTGVDELLGPGRTERRETPSDVLRVREWDGSGRAMLFVSLQADQPVGSTILHLQPSPTAVPADPPGTPRADPPPPSPPPATAKRSPEINPEAAARRAKRRRGLALKTRAQAHLLGGGVVAFLGGVGGGAALGVLFLRDWDDSSVPLGISFGVSGGVLGIVGTALLVAGGAMDIHANILLGRRGTGFNPELRLALGVGHVEVALRF